MIEEALKKAPAIRLLTVFIVGVLFQIFFALSFPYLIVVLAFLFISFFALTKNQKLSTTYHLRWVFGIYIYLIFFLIGLLITELNTYKPEQYRDSRNEFAIVTIVKQPAETAKSIKAIVEIDGWERRNAWFSALQKAVVYFEKNDKARKLRYGDRLIIQHNFSEITNAGNPYEFDYKRYMANKSVYFQTYVKGDNWKLLETGQGNYFLLLATRLRNKLLKIYEEAGLEGDDLAVVSALTLGYKDKLDPEIKQSFSASGAMHILAVSGLHVGIIYLIISNLLIFFARSGIGFYIKTGLIILFLWFFAFLSGLSPSVLRATLMLSFVIVGMASNRAANIYNTLAVSAFVLLIYNPYLIMEVGFQLSYAAVVAIVWLQPPLFKLVKRKNRIWNYLMSLLTVSVAAQLGTAPIGLYYFHQFPSYFFITNLVVIPMVMFIIYAALFLFLVASILPQLAVFAAYPLKALVGSLNYFVKKIEALPHSSISDIPFSWFSVYLLFGILLLSIFFFQWRKLIYLKAALSLSLFFVALSLFISFQKSKTNRMVVYNIKKQSAYDFIQGNKNHLLTHSQLPQNKQQLKYAVQAHWLNQLIDNQNIIDISENNLSLSDGGFYCKSGFINFYGKRFFILNNNELSQKISDTKIKLDYLIVANNVKFSIQKMLDFFDVKQIIFDSSNSFYRLKKWKIESQELPIDCFFVAEKGAFVLEL